METKFWQLHSENDEAIFKQAGALLRDGELVAFPTETVYGLGANGLDGRAVRRIYEAKGRPSDNPLILHIADISEIYALTENLNDIALKLAKNFWPGPMTLVVPKSKIIPDEVSAGLPTVAVRFPVNKDAQRLIKAAGVPVAAPSANLSGKPSPTTAQDVMEDMDGKIAAVLDGGKCAVGLESTIIDTTGAVATILRPGQITPEMIAKVLGAVELDGVIKGDETAVPKAPGMKYRHYAPQAPMYLCRNMLVLDRNIQQALAKNLKVGVIATQAYSNCANKVFLSVEDLANKLFYYLRDLDRAGVDVIYAETVSEDGLGLAVMNRMRKAAGNQIL